MLKNPWPIPSLAADQKKEPRGQSAGLRPDPRGNNVVGVLVFGGQPTIAMELVLLGPIQVGHTAAGWNVPTNQLKYSYQSKR